MDAQPRHAECWCTLLQRAGYVRGVIPAARSTGLEPRLLACLSLCILVFSMQQNHFSMPHNRNGEMSFCVAQAADMESCGKGLCLMWGHLPKSSHEPGPVLWAGAVQEGEELKPRTCRSRLAQPAVMMDVSLSPRQELYNTS